MLGIPPFTRVKEEKKIKSRRRKQKTGEKDKETKILLTIIHLSSYINVVEVKRKSINTSEYCKVIRYCEVHLIL